MRGLFRSLLPKSIGFSSLGGEVVKNLFNTIDDVFENVSENIDKVMEETMNDISQKDEDQLGIIEQKLWIPLQGNNTDINTRRDSIGRKLEESTIHGRNSVKYIEYCLHNEGFTDARVVENLFWSVGLNRFVGVNPYFTDIDIMMSNETDSDQMGSLDPLSEMGRYSVSGQTDIVANTIIPTDGDNRVILPLSDLSLKYSFVITGALGTITEADRLDVESEKERLFRDIIMKTKPAQSAVYLNVNYI